MVPYTVSIYPEVWHIDGGVPINRYRNHEWFLPDGRRLMVGHLKNAPKLLQTKTLGFQLVTPVVAEVAYPTVMFPEGEQPWISLCEVGVRDNDILLYFDVNLTDGYEISPLVPSGVNTPSFANIEWLLPLQPSLANTTASHGGLAILKPGQMSALMVVDPQTEVKIIRVIASERNRQPMLGYAI